MVIGRVEMVGEEIQEFIYSYGVRRVEARWMACDDKPDSVLFSSAKPVTKPVLTLSALSPVTG